MPERLPDIADVIRRAQADVASWPEYMRQQSITEDTDQAILDGIEILKKRLRILEGEAYRRGLLP